MKLFEYQAKKIFAEAEIPIPAGKVIENVSQLDDILGEVGLPCVLKAQVLSGGRGKAGLIQFASSKEEAKQKAEELFSSEKGVRELLVEEKLDIETELYMSITYEPLEGKAILMASASGGVDIEELARTSPEKVVTEHIDVTHGLLPFHGREVMFKLGLSGDVFKQGMSVLSKLYDLYRSKDAVLVEINPLVVTSDGSMVAADAKIDIDDNSLFRQPEFSEAVDNYTSEIEYDAAKAGIPYVQFDGDISLLCAGAGLTNTVYDLINDFGGSVANYLEFGGPNYKRGVEAMEFALRNKPKVILVVTFGTIARADVVAQGIADGKEKWKPQMPIVTAIRGTYEEEAREILQSSGVEVFADTEQAVKRAIKLCRED